MKKFNFKKAAKITGYVVGGAAVLGAVAYGATKLFGGKVEDVVGAVGDAAMSATDTAIGSAATVTSL